MFSRQLLLQAALGISSVLAFGSKVCPAGGDLSCHASATGQDSCCFESPGGQLLLTQFWDTGKTSTGPSDSWTLHGLWPDNCDGTYEQFCDPSRELANVTAVMQAASPCTLKYMQKYWKDYQGQDESFWEHEWNKHGTCFSTLQTKCYPNYTPSAEAVDFFVRAVALFKALPSYDWLAAAGIVPSTTATYSRDAINAALKAHHGADVIINCNSAGELDELWYHYNVRGSIPSGQFETSQPVGSPSTCPATGIKYIPKYLPGPTLTGSATSSPPSATATTPAVNVPPTPTGGTGFLYVETPADTADGGFMISGGKWYHTSGTPAGYTAHPVGDGTTFTFTTSKGACAFQDADSSLLCATTVTTPSVFGFDGKYVTYNGANTYYADSLPSGQAQGTVYSVAKAVSLKWRWQSK